MARHERNDAMEHYKSLVELSNDYLKDLKFLIDLSNQLHWVVEQHDVEVGRDWTNCIANFSTIQRHYEWLMQELKIRQPLWCDLVKRSLNYASHHPAHLFIVTNISALESESEAFLQLFVAFEMHLEQANQAKLFQDKCMEAEHLISTDNEHVFSNSNDVQQNSGENIVKEQIDEFISNHLPVLKEKAMKIKPLVVADSVQQPPKSAEAICSYQTCTKLNSNSIAVRKGTQLVKNGSYKITQLNVDGKTTIWKVVAPGISAAEFSAPAVCFALAAPSKSCLEQISSLEARLKSRAMLVDSQLTASRKSHQPF